MKPILLNRCLRSILCLSAAAVLVFTQAAPAAVIFDNFDAGGGFHPQFYLGAAQVATDFFSTNGTRAAAQFTVTGGNFNLTSITLPISVQNSVPGNFLRVRLTADAAGVPGSTLEVLSENQSVWPNFADPFTTATTLSSTTHPLLSNGAKYWIVTEPASAPASAPAFVSYRWSYNTNGATVPFRQETEAGLPSDPWGGASGFINVAFRVEGTNNPCQPEPILLFNTGIGTNGSALPLGAADPHFTIPINPNGGGAQAYAVAASGLTNTAASQWIAPSLSGSGTNGTYLYQITFNLPCTNEALISGRWAVDNDGAIFVNNQPNPIAELTGGASANFTTWHPFAISDGLVAGQNTLYFYVTNFSNLTGLRVELDGSANCCCPSVNTVSLNTGFNQAAGSVYALGLADAFWRVTADPTVPPSTLPRPATVIQGNPAWQTPQANSQWISSYPTEVNNLNGAYVFETDFCLTPDASNVVVNVCLRADDSAGVSLNGHPLALSPANTTFGAAAPACGAASMVVNPGWFLSGKNTLTVIVTNSGAVAMGLNLSGTVTGSGLIDPNSECCRPTSGISGQKYFDFNANGVRDAGEPALAGWTIQLSNGQEVVTDVNGFYYFPNLAGGVYAVTEVMQPGWTQITPASGSNVVAVGTAQQINGVNFGNWHTNDPACFQIYCPSNLVVYAAPNVLVNYTVTATNLCSTNEPILYCTPPPNSLFPVGTTTVNCTAYDLAGNHSECDFTVTVIDTTPVFTNCPASTNLGCNPVNIPDCDPNVGATNSIAGASPAYLLVSSENSDEVRRYNATSGAYIDNFVTSGSGGLSRPRGLALGLDGNLYVSSFNTYEVKRYNGTTGAFMDNFVTSGSGGLFEPFGLVFGSDGNLYVSSFYTSEVKRYNGTTGAFIDNFVTSGSGGLGGPLGLVFGSDGKLYVSSYHTTEVKRYNGTTGAFMDNFVTSGSGGLNGHFGLVFGSDDNLYVSSLYTAEVKRYNGTTGAFMDNFVTSGSGGLTAPYGLGFGPDGNLYVSSYTAFEVKRYNGTTGAFMDNFTSGGGLFAPASLIFTPFVGMTCDKLDTTNGCTRTRTITYTATSNYGATNTCVQVITWTVDTTPPVITNYPAGGDLGCNPTNLPTDAIMQALIGAVDDCGTPTINVSHVDNGSPCGMNRTFTISASDACGNTSGTFNINYTWVADTNAPTLTAGSIGSCYPSVAAAQNAALDNTPNSDECGSVNMTASTVGTCSAVVTVTGTDTCGNSASVSYNTRIITTPPIITSIPAGTDLGCNPTNLPTDATVRALVAATNVCGLGSTNVTHVDAGPACAQTRTFTITVQGQCGPAAVTNVIYTWSQDTQAPVITCFSNKTVVCGPAWSFDAPVVADGCSGTNVVLNFTTVTNGNCPQVMTRTWIVSDPCGNTNTCSQTVTVVPSLCQLGWWPGDGNGNNLAGGHAGALLGGVGFTAGMVGQAFNFTGSGQSVEVPNTAALDITGAISIEAWIKPSVAGGNQVILNKATAGTPDGYYFDVLQGHLRLLVGYAGSPSLGVYFVSLAAIPANEWTHVAATYDGQVIKLYLNGALDNSMAFTDPFPGPNGRPLLIGNSSGAEWFLGAIDEVGLYNCILSSNDVAAIYAAGSSGKAKPSGLVCSTNKTVECGTAWSFDVPTWDSACSGTNLAPTVFSTITTGTCPTVITRSWLFVDGCGNSNSCSQTVTVVDTTPPVMTCFSNKTVVCGPAWSFDAPVVADGCSGTNVAINFTTVTNGNCPQVMTRTWIVSDPCGNTNTCSQTVTVVPSLCQLGWWPGDGNGNNLAGGHAGALLGGVGFTAGMVGQAFNFTGSGQSMEVPNTAALDITGAISIEAWIKPTIAYANNAILNKATAGTADGYYFDVYQSRLRLLVGNAGALGLGSYFQSTQFIPTNQWTHVAATYDGAVIKLYLNGVLDNSMAFTDPFPGPNGRPLLIGNTSLGGVAFQGAMDEVGLYNCILSTNEIAAIYAAGSSGKAKPSGLVCAPDKIVACGTAWNFDPPTSASLCCTNLEAVILNTVTNGICPLVITRTWQATDCCGNSNLCSQIVTVADDVPPVLTCSSNKTVECGAAWDFDPPVAMDACSGTNVLLTILNTQTNGSGCTQTFTRNWVATDLCGNTNTCSQTVTVTVTGPQTPPVITGISYNATGLHISIQTLPCYTYALECKENLLDPTWNICQTANGTGANHEFIDPPPLPSSRFYRVRLLCP